MVTLSLFFQLSLPCSLFLSLSPPPPCLSLSLFNLSANSFLDIFRSKTTQFLVFQKYVYMSLPTKCSVEYALQRITSVLYIQLIILSQRWIFKVRFQNGRINARSKNVSFQIHLIILFKFFLRNFLTHFYYLAYSRTIHIFFYSLMKRTLHHLLMGSCVDFTGTDEF